MTLKHFKRKPAGLLPIELDIAVRQFPNCIVDGTVYL